jgi:hypothetical protein
MTVAVWGLSPTYIRTARKEHDCRTCHEPIGCGERYAEYLGEAPAWQNGHRYHLACAKTEGVIVEGERPYWHAASCGVPWTQRSEDGRSCACGGSPASYDQLLPSAARAAAQATTAEPTEKP